MSISTPKFKTYKVGRDADPQASVRTRDLQKESGQAAGGETIKQPKPNGGHSPRSLKR